MDIFCHFVILQPTVQKICNNHKKIWSFTKKQFDSGFKISNSAKCLISFYFFENWNGFLDDFSFICSGVTSSWKLAFIELLSLWSRLICDLLLPLEVYFCLDEYVWLQTHLCHNKLTSDFVFLGSCSLVATAGHSSESKNVAMWDTLLPQKKALIACNYFFKLIHSR